MVWLILEALAAGGLLVFIIWWTMFSGRDAAGPQEEAAPGEREKGQGGPPR